MNAGFSLADRSSAEQASADHPVTFANTVGLYRPPNATSNMNSADVAVLFLSSWGFEELCARKFWRLLAADLASQGLASMRFDYPGTGDALDPLDEKHGLDTWLDSIQMAASTLRELSEARHLILVGHGLGGLLAWKAAETLENVAGLAMAAPALSGRNWLREFAALSRVANPDALQHKVPSSGPAMGEQVFPDAVAKRLRALNISSPAEAPSSEFLLLKQNNRPADAQFELHLSKLGVTVHAEVFPNYNEFVRDVLFSVPSKKAIESITRWSVQVASKYAAETVLAQRAQSSSVPPAQPLAADGFRERPVRFGEKDRLYGILCEPLCQRRGATVIVVPTGYERMSGWGRISAQLCRELARDGIASFRFDMANVADSPCVPGAPEQVLYRKDQLRDVSAAIDFLEREKLLPVVVSGRCSGAWTAFKSGVMDKRVSGIVPVNAFDFYIPEDINVDDFLRSTRQSLSGYGSKLFSGSLWKRVLKGEVRVFRGLFNLSVTLLNKALAFLTPLAVKYPYFSERHRSLKDDFASLRANQTKVTLVYTQGDVGMSMLESNFGAGARLLSGRYGDPKIVLISDADHNLTTAEARREWTRELMTLALQFQPQA